VPTVWPFVGRGAQLSRLRAALRRGGAVVAGDAGVGKSRLALEAVHGLEARFSVLHAGGTEAGTGIPFGAFAQHLPAASASANGPGNVLRWAADALRPPPGRRLLIVVDDAHLLDRSSAALAHHLVLHRQATLLATVRSGERMPDPVVALWKDELVVRLDLGPLAEHETAQLLIEVLGGPVEAAAVRHVWRTTRGNVLFLRELVIAAQATGRLSLEHGVWRWRGGLPLGDRLRELVATRLGAIDADVRDVVEFVTFGEPLGIGLLEALTSPGQLERAEERHLITADRDGRRLQVRLAHPLYGELIRAETGELHRRATLARLADAVEATGMRRRDDPLKVALWRLDAGAPADPAALLAGCRLAWAMYDLDDAARLGMAAVAAGADPAAAAEVGMIMHFASCYPESEQILARVDPATADDQVLAQWAYARAMNLAWGLGRKETAHDLLNTTIARLASPAARQELELLQAVLYVHDGRCADARRQAARARALGSPTPRVAAQFAALEGIVLAHTGYADEALRRSETALADLSRQEASPNLLAVWGHICIHAAVFRGDLPTAEAHTARTHQAVAEREAWKLAQLGLAAARAQNLRLRGKIADAVRQSREGMPGEGDRVNNSHLWCLGELAYSAAQAGDSAATREALALFERYRPQRRRIMDFFGDLAEPWLRAAEGDPAAAAEALVGVAAMADELEMRGLALFALHDAVRLGAGSRVADDLGVLAPAVAGPLAALLARHASAQATADGAELDEVAKRFRHLGMLLYAAEASAQAAQAHAAAQRERAAARSAALAASLAARCPGAHTPALRGLSFPELTERQREIAQLAATGLSNREIADRLVLSVRTVANHLAAAYDRLGVNDRGQLATLLGADDH
jgi:DNA-binding CsgD family transcriptional regulator